jgi:hypothetical protein
MQLTLKWKNHNVLSTTTEIYRSTSPIDKNALPAVHANVNAALEQYVDTVEYGKRYYYMMKNTNSKGSAFTENSEVWAVPRSGPGPQNLFSGDMNVGYFGYVKHNDFVSALGLLDKLGRPFAFTTTYDVNWHKFAYKGKIVYVPNCYLCDALVSIQTLYNAGLVFGTDDNGANQYGATPRNQKRVVNIKGDDFLVRCMRMNDSPDKVWDGLNTNIATGEWYNLILRGLETIPSYQVGDNIASLVFSMAAVPTNEFGIINSRDPMQEKVSGSAASVSQSSTTEAGLLTYGSAGAYNGNVFYYRPVLELVASAFI